MSKVTLAQRRSIEQAIARGLTLQRVAEATGHDLRTVGRVWADMDAAVRGA